MTLRRSRIRVEVQAKPNAVRLSSSSLSISSFIQITNTEPVATNLVDVQTSLVAFAPSLGLRSIPWPESRQSSHELRQWAAPIIHSLHILSRVMRVHPSLSCHVSHLKHLIFAISTTDNANIQTHDSSHASAVITRQNACATASTVGTGSSHGAEP